MKLKLERLWPKPAYTVGRLYVDGKLFCNTLEDKVADVNRNGVFDGTEKKVPGETAIPYGTYTAYSTDGLPNSDATCRVCLT